MTTTTAAAAAVLLLAVAVAVAGAERAPLRVAVIGAGIGGGSAAYYASQMVPGGVRVDAFEARDYVGGRLKHTVRDGTVVELGGDAWSSINYYVAGLAKELGVPVSGGSSAARAAAGGSPLGFGVWNGTAFEDVLGTLLRNVNGDVSGVQAVGDFMYRMTANYALRGAAGVPFQSIAEFLEPAALGNYTSAGARPYLERAGVPAALLDAVADPVTRTIYDQGVDEMHAFGALVSLSALVDGYGVVGGNSLLVEALFNASGARVHLETPVRSVTRGASDGLYTLALGPGAGAASAGPYDAVVVAAPWEHAALRLEGPGVAPPPGPPREFVRWFVNFVGADAVRASYFGAANGSALPDEILTSRGAAAAGTPFADVQHYADTAAGPIFKLFSNANITGDLPRIFTGVRWHVVEAWPYTFPRLVPRAPDTFQPVRLAPRLYYLNGMESVASAMECSVIAGRNAAMLLAESGTR